MAIDSKLMLLINANNPGIWAFHCHITYHHVRGMFNVVAYRSADLSWWNPTSVSHEHLQFSYEGDQLLAHSTDCIFQLISALKNNF